MHINKLQVANHQVAVRWILSTRRILMSIKTLTVIAAMAVGTVAFSEKANAQFIGYPATSYYTPGVVTASYYAPMTSYSYYSAPYVSGYYGTPYYGGYYSYPTYAGYAAPYYSSYYVGPRRWWWRY
jgi:hypothetical protein